MYNKITEFIPGKSAIYENDITKIESTTLYNFGSYQFNVGNLLNDSSTGSFVGLEGTNFTVTSFLKIENAIITKIYLAGRPYQCVKDFKLEYLNETINKWVNFYTGTLSQNTNEIIIDMPPEISTKSIRITSINYYHNGPALSEFYFEYEIKNKNTLKEYIIPYTGKIESLKLSPGIYELECWGAQGGQGSDNEYANTSWNYGKGGYSFGEIEIFKTTTLYICVGGRGLSYSGYPAIPTNSLVKGGYNGGGNTFRDSYEFGGSGGGATHIALQSGLLSSLESKKDSILLVAGGGGGSGEDDEYAGHGGSAITLPTGYYDVNSYKGTFGQGSNYVNSGESGGGGGGGYIGGYGGQGNGSNGGTGYASPKLYSIYGQTGVRNGNGLVRITLIDSNIRRNSNFYKDSYYQEHFDFNKLIGGD